MIVKIERRWIVAAFKHPDLEHSVYYRKGIKHLDRAVMTAQEKGANLISIRGFDISVEYGSKIEPIDGQESLE